MRVHLGLIALIGLLLLAGAGSAVPIPDQNSILVSSTDWVVVAHQSTITAYAYNSTSLTPVPGATVTMALNATTLGTLVMNGGGITDASGQASATFSAGTKTGAVNITATITYNDGGNIITVTKVYTQKIDHDVAQNAAFDFLNEVTVGTETPFNISFTDQYGNPIDNRNPADPHSISLWVSASSDNMAAFNVSGSHVPFTTLPLDANGNISVSVLTDTVPGENTILLSPFQNVGIPWGVPQFIYGINDGIPCSMTQIISPSTLTEPADNAPTHVFTITDTLYDKYGNPTENQGVIINSNWPGDTPGNMTTNPFGQIIYYYGPHSASGYVALTATSVSNLSVSTSQTVQFFSTAPVNMLFSATPQVMPSLDAQSGQTSQLIAKVVDIMGNPVANQNVTFSMGSPTYTYPNCVLGGPQLLNTVAVTNTSGLATVTFIPGKFDTNKSNVTYDPTDTGSVVVTATWNGIQDPIQLNWKNYPYLSEQTTIVPQNINVNSDFYVTISLSADGFNLTGHPADIVIVSDLAGGIGGPELLTQTTTAEKGFVKNATNDTYIGLVTFGNSPNTNGPPYASNDTINLWNQQKSNWALRPFNPYGTVTDYSMVDPAYYYYPAGNGIRNPDAFCFTPSKGSGQKCVNATNPSPPTLAWSNPCSDAKIVSHLVNAGSAYTYRNTLISDITGYVSYGGTDYAAGINGAIQELNQNGNPSHNQTIIIMGDGINMMAPIAPGSLESYWPSDWYPRPSLGYFDESDVGKAAAVDAANRAKSQGMTIYGIGFSTPNSAYGDAPESDMPFFQSLTSPGAYYFTPDPTNMSSIFQQIEGQIQNTAGVNTTMVLNLQNAFVTYNNATSSIPGNQTFAYVYNPPVSTTITDQNGNTYSINQTAQWLNNQTLLFNIGKMTVGQTWSTTFEMQLLQPGTMDFPGNQSNICFNTGECEPTAGGTINGGYDYTNTGFSMPTIAITDLQALQNNTISTIVPLQWNITYPGSQFATETVYYNSLADPTWRFIYQQPVNPGNWTQSYNWNVASLPPGVYSVEVIAYAHDANSGKEIIPTGIQVGLSTKAFIRLQ
jgi:hypothetical protein